MGRLGKIMMVCALLLAGLAVAAPISMAWAQPSGQPTISDIRRGSQGNASRIVIESTHALPYRAFLLEGPNRLVIDVGHARWQAPRNAFFQDKILKGYRSGDLEGGLTRLVFDLSQPAVIDKSFILPAGGALQNRLVVDVRPVSQNLFTAALKEVHGDAKLRERQLAAPAVTTSSGYRNAANERIAAVVPVDPAAAHMLPVRKPGYIAGGVPGAPLTARPSAVRRVIILDAGHGGHDPGALGGRNVREKDITLAMAKALKRELEETGRYTVHLTRDSDIFIPLRQRVAIARAKGGELFLSLHADKVDRTNVRGASIYTLSENASDAETARLADQENKAGMVAGVDLSGEEADVADILLDLAMREKMNESNLLARYLEESMRRKNIRLLPNSHRSAGFAVLKAPDVPSALLEIGFLSNPDEAKLLSTKDFQTNMARALREGIDAYFTKILALQKI